jgi:hypothetical protein
MDQAYIQKRFKPIGKQPNWIFDCYWRDENCQGRKALGRRKLEHDGFQRGCSSGTEEEFRKRA